LVHVASVSLKRLCKQRAKIHQQERKKRLFVTGERYSKVESPRTGPRIWEGEETKTKYNRKSHNHIIKKQFCSKSKGRTAGIFPKKPGKNKQKGGRKRKLCISKGTKKEAKWTTETEARAHNLKWKKKGEKLNNHTTRERREKGVEKERAGKGARRSWREEWRRKGKMKKNLDTATKMLGTLPGGGEKEARTKV